MNKFLLAVVVLLFTRSHARAQNQPSLNEHLQAAFEHLDQSAMNTGYLINQQFSFVEAGLFQGSNTDTTRADINFFGALFGAISNSGIMNGGQNMPYPSYLDSVKTGKPEGNISIVAIEQSYGDFAIFTDNNLSCLLCDV